MTQYKDLTKTQRWALADKLAEDRLPKINMGCEPVVPSETLYARFGKRVLDVVISGIALLVTLPFNLIAAVLTKIDVGSPIFFRQERAGRNEKNFIVVKFRNMTNDIDERGELLPPSQRITKFGYFMRRTSLDELLNFWSVFKGDMSIIGPRPLPPEYVHRLSNRHRARFFVRPGLECPPRSVDFLTRDWNNQFENDVWYVEHVSFSTDLMMLWNLIRFACSPRASEIRASVTRGTFVGYNLDGYAMSDLDLDQAIVNEFSSVKGGN